MLRQAEIGRYEANNLQQVPFRYIDRYFTFSHGMYEVAPEIKQFVFFSEFDLLSPDQYCPPACIYGDFDLVFCCNVLFYYNEKTRKLLLGKLSRCLHPQGYLVTSETERALIPHRNFSETYPPSAIFLKKN
jgi:chemotaxis methyl-accepting protein methylase